RIVPHSHYPEHLLAAVLQLMLGDKRHLAVVVDMRQQRQVTLAEIGLVVEIAKTNTRLGELAVETGDQRGILSPNRPHLDIHAIAQSEPFTQLFRIRHDRETSWSAQVKGEVHAHDTVTVKDQGVDFQPTQLQQIRSHL